MPHANVRFTEKADIGAVMRISAVADGAAI